MPDHPAIITFVDRVRRDVIGGAADIARECVQALTQLVKDSLADNMTDLNSEFQEAVIAILHVMPSFAPPINAINRLLMAMEVGLQENKSINTIKQDIQTIADIFYHQMEESLEKISQYGAEKVPDNSTVFMYSMSSTVWRILQKAKTQGKTFHVIVTESRPAKEGLLTIDAMLKHGIPVSVSIDACIGELIPQANVVFVGADAISSNGVAYCKVGTYPSALVAKRHSIPFYIAADTLKFDPASLLGLPFRHDRVHREDVLDSQYSADVQVVGTMFDETPADLITGIITEAGVLHISACFTLFQRMELSQFLASILPAWAYGKI